MAIKFRREKILCFSYIQSIEVNVVGSPPQKLGLEVSTDIFPFRTKILGPE